ncbi:hypothetical protein LJC74_04875 [Eubacteriales bacterium OttesenSCG-928-A19]|nr:hypothetical protein [Eubacteriales bacterium OttesenSCG-928-A19]
MNDRQWQQVEAQLPQGAGITKVYNAAENGELRIIVQIPDERYETRYIAHFEGEDVRLEHRP